MLERRHRRRLRGDAGGHRLAVGGQQHAGEEHRLDDRLARGLPEGKLEAGRLGALARVGGGFARQARQDLRLALGHNPLDLMEEDVARPLFRIEELLP
jgi:hypothetical protein